jgi:hypothetical protein
VQELLVESAGDRLVDAGEPQCGHRKGGDSPQPKGNARQHRGLQRLVSNRERNPKQRGKPRQVRCHQQKPFCTPRQLKQSRKRRFHQAPSKSRHADNPPNFEEQAGAASLAAQVVSFPDSADAE